MEINPGVKVQPFSGNIIYGVGLGVFRAMDLVLCGLDSREARVAVNEKCWRVGVPWIDGAIEVLFGVARVFMPPDGACYECTMNEADYQALKMRRSCALLTRSDMLAGKVPTTPTTASVIAGIQVQEAVKLLHPQSELPTLASKGFVFNGLSHDSYVVNYTRREDCLSHFTYAAVEERPWQAETLTLAEALAAGRERLGPEAVLEFEQEIVTALACKQCDTRDGVVPGAGGGDRGPGALSVVRGRSGSRRRRIPFSGERALPRHDDCRAGSAAVRYPHRAVGDGDGAFRTDGGPEPRCWGVWHERGGRRPRHRIAGRRFPADEVGPSSLEAEPRWASRRARR